MHRAYHYSFACHERSRLLGERGNENKSIFRRAGIPYSGWLDDLCFLAADNCQRCDFSSQSSPRLKSALSSAPVELASPILYRRAVVATVLVEAAPHLHRSTGRLRWSALLDGRD